MKVMVIVKASKSSEAGVMPSEQLLREMGAYNEELVKAGIMLAGEGLHPSSKGVRVRFDGKKRQVIDGPFAETKELAAGFWMWKVKSMAEAIEWLKKCPNPMDEISDVEIRPVFEAEDFGAEFTPELREQEASLRAQTLGLSEIRYENKGEFLVAGLGEHFTAQTTKDIPALWERFVPVATKLPNRVEEHMAYGVCYNCREDCQFDYIAAIEVASELGLPADWKTLRIPASRYAVFTHGGHVSELPKTVDAIWSKWAPECGLKIAGTPNFERYTKEFNGQTGGMELWIPIAS
jgi:AraC family transcriptional regulator